MNNRYAWVFERLSHATTLNYRYNVRSLSLGQGVCRTAAHAAGNPAKKDCNAVPRLE